MTRVERERRRAEKIRYKARRQALAEKLDKILASTHALRETVAHFQKRHMEAFIVVDALRDEMESLELQAGYLQNELAELVATGGRS